MNHFRMWHGESRNSPTWLFVLALALSIAAAPLIACAQEVGKAYRVGILEAIPAAQNAANLAALREGLRDLGYVEGRNLVIEYRSADGHAEQFPDLAADLVRLNVGVIVTRGTPAALAAKHATGTIPIVMASSGDPVRTGIVTSLAHPGGNVTGLSALATDVQGKQLEVLREMVPGIARIAFLFNMSNPVLQAEWNEAEPAASSVGIQPQLLDVRSVRDLAPAFDVATQQHAGALIVGIDGLIQANRGLIVQAAAMRHLPTISREREFVDAGGLMSYGIHYPDSYHRAASYVDKIFKGAKPADLPVEQPTRLEMVINLKTAKVLGLTIPQSILVRADEVIQ